jgi:hypothetical protein
VSITGLHILRTSLPLTSSYCRYKYDAAKHISAVIMLQWQRKYSLFSRTLPHEVSYRYMGYGGARLTSQNCGINWPIVHLRVIVMWTVVWWYRLRLTPNSSTRGFWQLPVLSGGPVSRDIRGESRRMGEGNENLVYPSPWDFKRYLTCRKILRHGTSGFTSHPKEGVLLICISLKIHRLGRVRTREFWVQWQAH